MILAENCQMIDAELSLHLVNSLVVIVPEFQLIILLKLTLPAALAKHLFLCWLLLTFSLLSWLPNCHFHYALQGCCSDEFYIPSH